MRSLLLNKTDESYLQKCATEHKFAYGVLIGQHAEPEKDVIVHLAKNGEEEVELISTPDETDNTPPQDISEIDKQALASQWMSARKMTSGCFEVFGVFVTSTKNDIADDKTFSKAKKLLYDILSFLTQGSNFNTFIEESKRQVVFLVYSTAARKAVCKSYTHSNNGGSFSPMECRFVEKPFEWVAFQCSYELDDIFPILDFPPKINIEEQFYHSIEGVKKNLHASEVFIQNESIDESLRLDSYIKLKYGKEKPEGPLLASIYLPLRCQISATHPVKVKEFNGTIRFSGIVSSRVWCNPRNTIADVKRFVRNDILQSLVARVQVYCDGLTMPNVSSDTIFISEPPRRIYFNLHAPTDFVDGAAANAAGSQVQFSEYIFRGEDSTVAVAQAKQVLDLEIKGENICTDLEGLPDDEAFSETSSEENSVIPPPAPTRDLSRTMYMLGITVSLLVLITAVWLHYMFR